MQHFGIISGLIILAGLLIPCDDAKVMVLLFSSTKIPTLCIKYSVLSMSMRSHHPCSGHQLSVQMTCISCSFPLKYFLNLFFMFPPLFFSCGSTVHCTRRKWLPKLPVVTTTTDYTLRTTCWIPTVTRFQTPFTECHCSFLLDLAPIPPHNSRCRTSRGHQ